ncbi:MAG TPA: tRNA pseudouridine(38-40) synthase TruA [Dehalococcoidia bacterium]|nr:tRNA pseudouridine(38-40) synthase TruA [Dehalococcoidia bacterium]
MSFPQTAQRVALLLEYQGAAYAGFQVQPGQSTIQGALESALEELYQEPLRVAGASRTDAGVHALGQVVGFRPPKVLPLTTVVQGLNYYLPKDIAVREASTIPETLDVRRDALRRTYRYDMLLRPARTALWRDWVYQLSGPLDVSVMTWGAGLVWGQRDWSAFAASLSPGRSPVRRVEATSVRRCGERLIVTMTANAFLPQQVRRTVGALLRLGQGKMTGEEFDALVKNGKPGSAEWPAPARGLCLTHIDYGDMLRFQGASHEDLSG